MNGKLWVPTALVSLFLLLACQPELEVVIEEDPLPMVQLEAAYYDTCLWSEEHADLRCWGYNDGAHGNGHTEEVGDSYGEIEFTERYCKTAATDQWKFNVEGGEDRGSCNVGRYEFTIKVTDQLDQIITSDAICERRFSSRYIMKFAIEELSSDAATCAYGGYDLHVGEDRNSDGVLQTNEMGEKLKPTLLPEGLSVVDIAVGYGFSCAILSDHTTRCWGSGDALGNADSAINDIDEVEDLGNQLPVVDLGTGLSASKITAVEDFVCAILDNGSVKCWGGNNGGQLGQGHRDSIGGDDGEMGDNLLPIDLGTNPQTTSHYKAIDIATAENTVCAVLEDGRVKCWGENEDGLHGLGYSSYNSDDNPHYYIGDESNEMGDKLSFVELPVGVEATAIYMAYGHACVTTKGNKLYCWGENSDGQLGIGDAESRGDGFYIREYIYDNGEKPNRKKEITELDGTELGKQLCSLAPNNGGIRGRIYIDTNTNDIVDNDEEILIERTVCDTDDLTAFLSARLYSYQARMEYGQFGSDFSEMGDALKPTPLGTSAEIKDVSIGYYNTCVLFDDNELKCFGDGDYRGADTDEDAGDTPLNTPDLIAPVDLGTDKIIADIASAGYQTCAAFVDATVKCWGYNEYGEAGYPQYAEDTIGDGDPEPEMGESLPFVEVR